MTSLVSNGLTVYSEFLSTQFRKACKQTTWICKIWLKFTENISRFVKKIIICRDFNYTPNAPPLIFAFDAIKFDNLKQMKFESRKLDRRFRWQYQGKAAGQNQLKSLHYYDWLIWKLVLFLAVSASELISS